MAQLILGHGVSDCFGTKLAPSRQYMDTKLAQPAQSLTLAQPAKTKHERPGLWAAMLPLWNASESGGTSGEAIASRTHHHYHHHVSESARESHPQRSWRERSSPLNARSRRLRPHG